MKKLWLTGLTVMLLATSAWGLPLRNPAPVLHTQDQVAGGQWATDELGGYYGFPLLDEGRFSLEVGTYGRNHVTGTQLGATFRQMVLDGFSLGNWRARWAYLAAGMNYTYKAGEVSGSVNVGYGGFGLTAEPAAELHLYSTLVARVVTVSSGGASSSETKLGINLGGEYSITRELSAGLEFMSLTDAGLGLWVEYGF